MLTGQKLFAEKQIRGNQPYDTTQWWDTLRPDGSNVSVKESGFSSKCTYLALILQYLKLTLA